MSCIVRPSHDDEQWCTDAGSCTTMIPKTEPTHVTSTDRMAGRETNDDRKRSPWTTHTCLLVGGQGPGFCKAPRGHFNCTDTTALIRLICMTMVLCSHKPIQIKTEMYSVYIAKVKSTRLSLLFPDDCLIMTKCLCLKGLKGSKLD